MLRDALESRIARLIERARAEDAGTLANAPPTSTLALVVEQQIDASIDRLVMDIPMRAAVRERPELARTWPLYVSAAKSDSAEDSALLLLWQLDSGRVDVPNDKAAIKALLTEAHALINAIEHQVTEDRHRIAMAIDAGHPHHSLVGGMRDMPKDGLRKRGAKGQLAVEDGYVEVLAPGYGSAQLHFPLACLSETIVDSLREWRGSKGLRHWAALQRLLSVEGGRSGRVTWNLDDHLEALGYSEKTRTRRDIRADVVGEVELLTKMELAVYDKNGKLRLEQALLTPILKAKRQVEDTNTWVLEGLTLEVHPLLYEGVRDPKTGELGKNWYPQTIEVAKLDDVRFPYAIALGIVLPIRWRWAWGVGKDHCALSGANLLNLAGIKYDRARASRAWSALQRNMDALIGINALGRYEWVREPETLNGLCHLYPPTWAVNRTIHSLPPIEKPTPKVAATGKELREWREGRGWTQAKLAETLGVVVRTVNGAEAKPDAALGPAVAKRLKDLVAKDAAEKKPPSSPPPELDQEI